MINDRRRYPDRRSSAQRRTDPDPAPPPHVEGDRREEQRRLPEDRRLSAYPFGPDDAVRITTMLHRTGTLIRCPTCNHELTLGPPIATPSGRHREVRCETCWRSIPVENVP